MTSSAAANLDRIEHAHRFTRAVSVGNPREFLQDTVGMAFDIPTARAEIQGA